MGEFSCSRNRDVESFIRSKAIRFEDTHHARTYLIFDENDMAKGIHGYFSLSFKEIVFQAEVSKSKAKKLDGISKNAKKARVFLIGQLAKNDNVVDNELNLQKILDLIYPIILKVQNSIGGRIVLLECENEPRLVKAYESCGFEILQNNGLVQMIQFVDNLVIEE